MGPLLHLGSYDRPINQSTIRRTWEGLKESYTSNDMKSSNPVYATVQSIKVVHSTIAKDLEDINKKVKESSMNLRRERVRLIKVTYLSIYLP